MNDIIVQFAVLWGIKIGSALSTAEMELAKEMKAYDSEELLVLLSEWAKDLITSDEEDTVEFFEDKLKNFINT